MVINNDRIAKTPLNIILLIDASGSMKGKRIKQVDQAIGNIKNYLVNLQEENPNVDFYLNVIPFNNDAFFYNEKQNVNIEDFEYDGIKCHGNTNLHYAYQKLGDILNKQSKGGLMPDFGGTAPIILLLTDGHPNGTKYKAALKSISDLPWFKVSLRYGIAIELNDDKTNSVLRDFVGNRGDVIRCVDSNMLSKIIEIIVITASKVKSTSTNVSCAKINSENDFVDLKVNQQIAEELMNLESVEW